MKQSEVIEDLIDKTNYCVKSAETFQKIDDDTLHYSHSFSSWNVLQCVRHLSLYGKFYLPEFDKKITKAKKEADDLEFQPGFWGKYFTGMMLPEEGKKLKTMKTFKSKNPDSVSVKRNDIKIFLDQQHQLLKLLEKAKSVNLNKNNCKLTLPLIKMNLGSTLQFVIFHHIRHIEQAKKVIKRKA